MNPYIVARTHASSAWNEINEHGVGRLDWLLEQCARARDTLNQPHASAPYELRYNIGDAVADLFAASHHIIERRPKDAMFFLESAMGLLEPLIASETVEKWD